MTEDNQSSNEESHHSGEEEQPETQNANNEEETVTFKELVSYVIFLKLLAHYSLLITKKNQITIATFYNTQFHVDLDGNCDNSLIQKLF